MVENQDIVQGAITKTKLSKNLRLDLTNLPKGTVGQIPIIQPDGNWGLVSLSGDVSIDTDGVTTVLNNAEITAADIDTAFNFIHDQKGYIHRSPQKEGDTVVYDVENTNYVTEVINNVNNVATGATKKFSITIAWGTDAANVSFEGSGTSEVATITHGLKTKTVVVSIQDLEDDIWTDISYYPFDLRAATDMTLKVMVEASSLAPAAGREFLVTIIG